MTHFSEDYHTGGLGWVRGRNRSDDPPRDKTKKHYAIEWAVPGKLSLYAILFHSRIGLNRFAWTPLIEEAYVSTNKGHLESLMDVFFKNDTATMQKQYELKHFIIIEVPKEKL